MATIHLVGRDCVVLLVRRYVCRSDPFPSDLAASFRFSCSSSPSVNKLVHPKRSWNVPTWPPPNVPQRWCFNRNPLRPKFPVAARSVWLNGSDNWTMMAIDWSQDNCNSLALGQWNKMIAPTATAVMALAGHWIRRLHRPQSAICMSREAKYFSCCSSRELTMCQVPTHFLSLSNESKS